MAALSSAAAEPVIVFAETAVTAGRDVRLGDVADLSGLPGDIRARAEVVVLTRFAPNQTVLRISSARLAERARAQLPILAFYLPPAPTGTVTVRNAAPQPAQPQGRSAGCLIILNPIASGAAPRIEDLAPAPCDALSPRRAFRFDRTTRVASAVRALNPGETVAAIPASSMAGVREGDAYVLTSRVGPVVVERRVTAVQSARPGERMFVKGADGEVFAAPQPDDERRP